MLNRWRNFDKKALLSLLLALLVALMVSVVGCGNQATTQGNTPAKIIRSTASDVPNIDPAIGSDYASSIALCNLYDTLVFPQNDGTVKPWVATDWTVSPDGLTYTFHLRKGVKFHTGKELTATDVIFSMDRLLAIGQGFSYLYKDVVKSVSAPDPYTVQFVLKRPFGPFVQSLVRLYIVNQDEVMAHKQPGNFGTNGDYGEAWLVSHDAGSGPYTVTELKKEDYMYAKRFPGFWGGWQNGDAPDAIQIYGTTDGATVRTMMANRQLEQTDQWQTEENLAALAKIPGVAIDAAFTGDNLNIMLNTKKPPTDDVHFRKALAYVFDYNTAVTKLFPGCKKAQGPVPFTLNGFDSNLPQYTTDLAKAKEELAQSKYADNLAQYPMDIAWISNVPDEEKVALLFQSDASQLGIKVNIDKMPWLSFVDKVATVEGTPNASIVFMAPDYDEAGSMLYARYDSKSCGTWEQTEWLKDPAIDKAIEDALATQDQAQRFAKYQAIQAKIVDLCPTIWVFDQAEKRAYQKAYVDWPGADIDQQGGRISPVMGYNFYYHDYKVYPDRIPR